MTKIVFWDYDGTLIDSEIIYKDSEEKVKYFKKYYDKMINKEISKKAINDIRDNPPDKPSNPSVKLTAFVIAA